MASPGPLGADPLIGTTIAGRYFVHQLLGRGGMGDVYKATQLGPDRPVALKVVRASAVPDAAVVRRFEREAAALSRLRHPSSVEVVEFGTAPDGSVYLAMELVPGHTLAEAIARATPFTEGRAARIAEQVLAALSEAHDHGIVHRDLKPANVMLSPSSDGTELVKVLDFGIATLAVQGDPASRLTQEGMVHGTPAYMSPEQIRGEPVDARSDLYSVGVMLFEMLTGALPFDGPTPMGIAARHLTDAPPRVSDRRAGRAVAPALEALIAQALEKDRGRRPASAAAMREELLRVAGVCEAGVARPAAALPPTAPFPAIPRRRRPRAVLGTAAAIAAVAAVAAAPLAARWRPAPPSPTVPAVPAQEQEAAPRAIEPPAPPQEQPREPVLRSEPYLPSQTAQNAERPRARASAARTSPKKAAAPSPPAAPAIRLVRGELNSVPTPPAATGDGVLVLHATPWAEVSLDGIALGETPREVRVAAGTYEVRAVHPELGARNARLAVSAGERRLWAVAFAP